MVGPMTALFHHCLSANVHPLPNCCIIYCPVAHLTQRSTSNVACRIRLLSLLYFRSTLLWCSVSPQALHGRVGAVGIGVPPSVWITVPYVPCSKVIITVWRVSPVRVHEPALVTNGSPAIRQDSMWVGTSIGIWTTTPMWVLYYLIRTVLDVSVHIREGYFSLHIHRKN